MSEKKSNFTAVEIRAGALVLVSVLILVLFVATIRGCRPKDETAKHYFATFTDIAGLNAEPMFVLAAFGSERSLPSSPTPGTARRSGSTAEVGGAVPVNVGSVANIQQISLTAEKHLEITTGDPDAALHSNGDTLASRTGSGGFIDIPDLAGPDGPARGHARQRHRAPWRHAGGGGGHVEGEVDLADVAERSRPR